jgi:hypothetical protein
VYSERISIGEACALQTCKKIIGVEEKDVTKKRTVVNNKLIFTVGIIFAHQMFYHF